MKIVILDYPVQFPNFHVNGASGKEYNFVWDKALSLYVFGPTSQEDVDDLFRGQAQAVAANFFTLSVLVGDEKDAVPPEQLKARIAELEAELAKAITRLRVATARPRGGKGAPTPQPETVTLP